MKFRNPSRSSSLGRVHHLRRLRRLGCRWTSKFGRRCWWLLMASAITAWIFRWWITRPYSNTFLSAAYGGSTGIVEISMTTWSTSWSTTYTAEWFQPFGSRQVCTPFYNFPFCECDNLFLQTVSHSTIYCV